VGRAGRLDIAMRSTATQSTIERQRLRVGGVDWMICAFLPRSEQGGWLATGNEDGIEN